MKKITVNGTVTLHQRYLYRGYLQIACADLTRSGHPCLWLITWDPTQPTTTRPLAIQKNGTWYTCGHDLTKNVTELYKTNGTIATAYDYTPFGQVTAAGINQPFQWSSEFYDSELGLVYYNYRHYNPKDGRWINRDPIAEMGGWNLYGFVKNNGINDVDVLGQQGFPPGSAGAINDWSKRASGNATTIAGLAQCNADANSVSQSCCVISYCILRQHINFYKDITGNLICSPCRELEKIAQEHGTMDSPCSSHFVRETIYIPAIQKKS